MQACCDTQSPSNPIAGRDTVQAYLPIEFGILAGVNDIEACNPGRYPEREDRWGKEVERKTPNFETANRDPGANRREAQRDPEPKVRGRSKSLAQAVTEQQQEDRDRKQERERIGEKKQRGGEEAEAAGGRQHDRAAE